MKILISGLTPEISKIVQPLLFAAGYRWGAGKVVKHVSKPCIFLRSATKELTYGYNTSACEDFTQIVDLAQEPLATLLAVLEPSKIKLGNAPLQFNKDGSLTCEDVTVSSTVFEQIEALVKGIKINGYHVAVTNGTLKIGCKTISPELFAAITAERKEVMG